MFLKRVIGIVLSGGSQVTVFRESDRHDAIFSVLHRGFFV